MAPVKSFLKNFTVEDVPTLVAFSLSSPGFWYVKKSYLSLSTRLYTMYIRKNFSFRDVLKFSGGHIIWLTVWMVSIALLFEFTHVEFLAVPWFPISVVGTAVAFYIGFKNNQAYDRLWEARKIWGAIVNSSRGWGSAVKGFVGDQFVDGDIDQKEIATVKQRLIYRHIAWLYTLRNQLLIPTPWEHISQKKHMAELTKARMKNFGIGLLDDDKTPELLQSLLSPEEYTELIEFKNTATQIIDRQSDDLSELRRRGLINDFRHVELQRQLNDFYVQQGKCERIKKFPLPRQYGSMSFIFVAIFIFLLPFSMMPELAKQGEAGIFIAIPISILVGWIYLMMELIGDYSENPFEGLGNDIPMMSLCRTIEIDLRQMLREEDLPPAIQAKNGVLM